MSSSGCCARRAASRTFQPSQNRIKNAPSTTYLLPAPPHDTFIFGALPAARDVAHLSPIRFGAPAPGAAQTAHTAPSSAPQALQVSNALRQRPPAQRRAIQQHHVTVVADDAGMDTRVLRGENRSTREGQCLKTMGFFGGVFGLMLLKLRSLKRNDRYLNACDRIYLGWL